ncbi:MAG: 1-acyl-sn-glycerol-3-phosphate acyltransferase [Candidatus Omnitrophica bacterium]|nr:1-acyl-sn-glycerol-3-phosphate acyltransferase [Candidatus Omnitrophota bacterium]
MEQDRLLQLQEHYGRATLIQDICIVPRQGTLWAVVVPKLDIFKNDNDTDIYGRVRWELDNLQAGLPADQHLGRLVLTRHPLERSELEAIDDIAAIGHHHDVQKTIAISKDEPWSDEDRAVLQIETAKEVMACVATLTARPIHLNSHWEIDLGIDSFARVELALRLEELFKIKIADELFYKATTVKELIDLVSSLTPMASEGLASKVKGWGDILRQPPNGEITRDIQAQIHRRSVVFNWLGGALLSALFKVCWSLKAEGAEHLPSKGPFIICPNHASFLDGLFIYNNLPFRHQLNAYFFGYYNIFYHKSMKWPVKNARLVAIDNNLHLKESLQVANLLLSHQKIACIFPEGMRSISDKIGPFYKGAAILAKELGVPIVPVFIHGSHQSWPRGCNKPRLCPVKVVFGRPQNADELEVKGTNGNSADVYERITRGLRLEVMKLREGCLQRKIN